VPEHYSVEAHKIRLSPLPKYVTSGELRARLRSLDIDPAKVKKSPAWTYAFICFVVRAAGRPHVAVFVLWAARTCCTRM